MAWKIEHQYDPTYRVITIRFADVSLASRADVDRWRNESEAHYQRLGVKADCLVDLDGLDVHAAVRRQWTEARLYLAERYMKKVYRFNGSARTKTVVYTGSVLAKAGGEVYPSREEALAALLRDRAAEGESR